MVQRYDQGNYCGGEYPCEMKEVGSGEFVEYFEYRNLKASHDKLVEAARNIAFIFPETDMEDMDAADFKDRARQTFDAAQKAKQALTEAEKI